MKHSCKLCKHLFHSEPKKTTRGPGLRQHRSRPRTAKDVGTRGHARTIQRAPPSSQTCRQPYSRRRSGLFRHTHDRLRRTTQAETGGQRTNNNVADNTAPNDRNQTRIRQTTALHNRQTQGGGKTSRNVTGTRIREAEEEVRVAAREGDTE